MADLGRWLAEDYRVAADPAAPEAGPTPDEVETD
jgi:endogenous inhibitor of DNA gyrase (YacG/DUF329 family)